MLLMISLGVLIIPVAIVAVGWNLIDSDRCGNTRYMSGKDLAVYAYWIQCDLTARGSITGFELTENGERVAKYAEDGNPSLGAGGKCGLLFRDVAIAIQSKWGYHQIALLKDDESVGRFRQSGFNYSKKELDFDGKIYSLAPAEKKSPDLEVRLGAVAIALITYHPSPEQNRSRRIYFVRRPDPLLEAMICVVGAFSYPRFGHRNQMEV
jgi:hypothetical protein